jgi:hypothetical protein
MDGGGRETISERIYAIAVIAGDGIGREIMPEGIRALEAASRRHGFTLRQKWHDFAHCDYLLCPAWPDDAGKLEGRDRRPTLPGRTLPIRSVRSGRRR